MNKYHNRNRIFNPIMTIHDILTLHILSFFPSSLSFLSYLSSLSSLSSLSLPLPSLFPSFFPSFFPPSLPFLLYLPSLPICFLCLLS